ncbi:MAG: PilZ domain-containing protein [Acidobacteria bacterium]|nr:PilZ domain-containing protein [Acidobacteriota bacterium]
MKDRRQYRRWRVSMPCSVKWEDGLTKGLIANISFGGALISEVSAVPPEGAEVALTFEAEEGEVQLEGKLSTRVVHTITELIEHGGAGAFGVQFEGSIEEIRSKLIPVFSVLTSKEGEPG